MKTFCGCCHLRTSAIVLAWLEVMGCMLVITAFAIPLDILPKLASYYSYSSYYYMKTYEVIQPMFMVFIVEQVIKSITCFLLIWGVVQRNHFFMQPWIVVQCCENVMMSVGIIGILITGGVVEPALYIALLPGLVLLTMGWYTWFCIRAVYKHDFIKSYIYWGEEYSQPLMPVEEMPRPNKRNQRDNYPRNYRHY